MPKLNRDQLMGRESVKNTKPSKNPPVTARGKVKLDPSLEDPRAYLGAMNTPTAKTGHTVITTDLDPQDRERNPVKGLNTESKSLAQEK